MCNAKYLEFSQWLFVFPDWNFALTLEIVFFFEIVFFSLQSCYENFAMFCNENFAIFCNENSQYFATKNSQCLQNRLLLSSKLRFWSFCQRIWCPGLHKGYQTWFFNDDWLDIQRFLRQLVFSKNRLRFWWGFFFIV